jgi:hypothetical protein
MRCYWLVGLVALGMTHGFLAGDELLRARVTLGYGNADAGGDGDLLAAQLDRTR